MSKEDKITAALKEISEALKNIGWEAVCASGSPGKSINTVKAEESINKLDMLIKDLES